MGTGEVENSEKYKEQGNEAFKTGNWDEALALYTKAISLTNEEGKDLATYLKNRAATLLKLENYEEVVKDCDKCLKIIPSEPKALYRRCQALEKLEVCYFTSLIQYNTLFSNLEVRRSIQRCYTNLQR